MLSIGRFAQLSKVSPRTVRYYESIGLIQSVARGENNYRYYDSHLVDRVTKIRDLQDLGFSLDEIKDILKISPDLLAASLRKKLGEVDGDLEALRERRHKLTVLLSVSQKIDSRESINDTERKQFMEAIQEEILVSLKSKHGPLSEAQLDYLRRDRSFETQEQRDFIDALKKCIDFAKRKNLKLGPSRGSSSSSIVLYALGVSDYDPTQHQLFPERLLTQAPNIHIDVEYERGQEFVDYCREITKSLNFGQIQAFKMPLLDILQNVDGRLGKEINYREIDDNADAVLNPFRKGDIEKIFLFDMSEDALIMKYENLLPEFVGLKKITEYVCSQEILNFRDVTNIAALWRPHSKIMVERLEQYKKAKKKPVSHECLDLELQKSLQANHGMIIYHEDILRILSFYTHWDLERCNRLRRDLFVLKKGMSENDIKDFQVFKKMVPAEIEQLIVSENPYSFCRPHTIAHCTFTKKTAVLKSLHKNVYYEEIEKWEQKHGFRWDDIGVHWKGVSLLQ